MKNQFNKQVELEALKVEVLAMTSTNVNNEFQGFTHPYSEDAFNNVAAQMRALVEESEDMKEKEEIKESALKFNFNFFREDVSGAGIPTTSPENTSLLPDAFNNLDLDGYEFVNEEPLVSPDFDEEGEETGFYHLVMKMKNK